MRRPKKLQALKPFPFRGEQLQAEEEFQPDTEEQSKLLITIGLAELPKRRIGYNTRQAQPSMTAVLTQAPDA